MLWQTQMLFPGFISVCVTVFIVKMQSLTFHLSHFRNKSYCPNFVTRAQERPDDEQWNSAYWLGTWCITTFISGTSFEGELYTYEWMIMKFISHYPPRGAQNKMQNESNFTVCAPCRTNAQPPGSNSMYDPLQCFPTPPAIWNVNWLEVWSELLLLDLGSTQPNTPKEIIENIL